MVERDFRDEEHDGYFTTGLQHERLIARLKNPHDGALPSGNGVHALNLLRLAELLGAGDLAQRAERLICSLGKLMGRYPGAFSQMLMAVDWLATGPREVVIAGERGDAEAEAFLRAVRRTFAPARVVALADGRADTDLMPLMEGRSGSPRAFVCRNYACQEPTTSAEELQAALRD